jgi:hypothetical protein
MSVVWYVLLWNSLVEGMSVKCTEEPLSCVTVHKAISIKPHTIMK